MKRLVVAVALLALTACKPTPTTQPAPPPPASAPKPATPLDVYRKCVKTNPANRAHQDACQRKAWGEGFSDDDERWACQWMGDLKCGPAERKA